MPVREFIRQYPEYVFSRAQFVFADYLERCGLRFLVDFGFENAESIAWEKLEAGEFMLGHA